MPTIFDNIKNHLNKGLNETLQHSTRTDFCVGYFNLRGWKEVADSIENLNGETIVENENNVHRKCRLLVGMQKMPIDIIKAGYSSKTDEELDSAEAIKLRKK